MKLTYFCCASIGPLLYLLYATCLAPLVPLAPIVISSAFPLPYSSLVQQEGLMMPKRGTLKPLLQTHQ